MLLINKFEHLLGRRLGAIHVGANVGEERDWYKKQGFNPVLWFEPNTELFIQLVENISKIGYEGQYAFNFGIHDTLESAKLHISNNAGQSSSILELGTHAVHHPDVKYIKDQEILLMRLDTFFKKENDIDRFNFLNVDVQGVELNVIKSMGYLIEKMEYVYVEVNAEEVYQGCSLFQDIDIYLKQFNILRIKTHWTKANWGDAFYKRY